MAQVYKMILYVCDLKDDFYDEIPARIKRDLEDDNFLCQFADGQVGSYLEWDDDLDLNKDDCPASIWETYFE